MSSCDVQANPSDLSLDEEAARVEKDSSIDSNNVETRISKNGLVPQPTKIPGPVGNSYIHTSTRKYTSLMKSLQTRSVQNDSFSSTSTLVNTTEDSGIQMDCSAVDDDNASTCSPIRPSSSTPRLQDSTESAATNESLQEFEAAEQLTLKVLQRAVAEMEADVALHAEILEEQIKLDLDYQLKQQMDQQVEANIEKNRLLATVEQQRQLLQEPNVESLQKLQLELKLELEESRSDSKKMQQQEEHIVLQTTSFPFMYERKHVRVESLLQAEDDIQMLQKLLQADDELVDGETGVRAQSNDESLLFELNVDSDVAILERLNDNDTEFSRKRVSFLHSVLHAICSEGIRKLSFPILFCGMAVGLIYYFRKD